MLLDNADKAIEIRFVFCRLSFRAFDPFTKYNFGDFSRVN
jgi:hypothetical protein